MRFKTCKTTIVASRSVGAALVAKILVAVAVQIMFPSVNKTLGKYQLLKLSLRFYHRKSTISRQILPTIFECKTNSIHLEAPLRSIAVT